MQSISLQPSPVQSQKRVPQVSSFAHSSVSGQVLPKEQSSTHTFTMFGPFGTQSGLAFPPIGPLTQSSAVSHSRVQKLHVTKNVPFGPPPPGPSTTRQAGSSAGHIVASP